MKRITGLVIFAGDGAPDVAGAVAELERHGFEVIRMPEKFRPLLHLPGDDFAQVWKPAATEEHGVVCEIMEQAREIVAAFGGSADSFGPARPDELPFIDLFDRAVLTDDTALAAEIERIAIERVRAWGRVGDAT
jgi:hypothetical protein